jgi:7-keto-8-aminopelargonate synthetase-like enzyme
MSKIRVSELSRRIDAELAALASQDQLRRLGAIDGVNLCSNDYLGLATDPRLREALASALAGTSRLRISLNAKLSTDLLARFTDALVSIREQEQVPVHAVRP